MAPYYQKSQCCHETTHSHIHSVLQTSYPTRLQKSHCFAVLLSIFICHKPPHCFAPCRLDTDTILGWLSSQQQCSRWNATAVICPDGQHHTHLWVWRCYVAAVNQWKANLQHTLASQWLRYNILTDVVCPYCNILKKSHDCYAIEYYNWACLFPLTHLWHWCYVRGVVNGLVGL